MESLTWFSFVLVIFCCFTQGQFQCTTKRKLIKQNFLANKINTEASLWSKSGVGSLAACSRDCVRDKNCSSLFYNKQRDVCTAHSVHLTSTVDTVADVGSLYYTLEGRDCGEIRRSNPDSPDGVYLIKPADGKGPVRVYCDMTTDGGGWTVFQRREDSTVKFLRILNKYKTGFGDVAGNFWLGNDLLNRLTSREGAQLRIDMLDYNNQSGVATYSTFRVENEAALYRLTVSEFRGNRGDSMQYHNGMQFTTKNRDNDKYGPNCAVAFHGAWWYNACHNSNVNGLYGEGLGHGGIVWKTWYGNFSNLKWTEMKLRFNA